MPRSDGPRLLDGGIRVTDSGLKNYVETRLNDQRSCRMWEPIFLFCTGRSMLKRPARSFEMKQLNRTLNKPDNCKLLFRGIYHTAMEPFVTLDVRSFISKSP